MLPLLIEILVTNYSVVHSLQKVIRSWPIHELVVHYVSTKNNLP